jgi:signal transduction histidine kinase/CheY-like chemotaxis protein
MATTAQKSDPPTSTARVRVLIADDDLGVRLLLKRWLERHSSFDVAEEAADGAQAVDAAKRVRPELAVLDLAMPRMDGLEAAAEIRRLLPDTRIVIRSAFSAERMAQKAIDAGADVYIEKAADRAQLIAVLEGLFPARDTGSGSAVPGVSPAPGPAQVSLDGLLLDALDVGVLLVDHDSRVTSANFASTLALGVPTSLLIGASLTDLLARARHEDGRYVGAAVPDPVTEALASGLPQSGRVLRLDKPGGGSAWLSINVRPIRGAEGSRATGAVAVITDVTEERRLRDALRGSDARLPGLLDAVTTPLALLRSRGDESSESADLVVAHANPAARALTGWMVGSRVPRETVSALDAHLQRIDDDEVLVAWQPAGSRSPGPMVPATGSRTGPSETTELLEAAVISSPVGAVLLDGSARLVIANPVADRLLGGSPLLGSGPPSRILRWADTRELVRNEDLPVQAACQGTPFDDVELFVTDEGGSDRGTYVKISGRPVLGPQGTPAGAVISVLDDTASKEAEQALAATHEELRRSNTELANFASTASHDLSQPLQKVYGFAQLLQEHSLDDAHAHDYIDRIVVGCERMRTLIRDLLAYSRLTSDARPFETVDLARVVQEVVELFEQEIAEGDARIEVDELPTVLADRTQMSQLFQNLIGNALTYVADGVPPVIHVHSARGEREWLITVEDNGIGIHPEDRERAFAMFERLVTSDEYAGTGIGLAVCAKIAERHGGRIWIEGNPSGGTSMCFSLPDGPPR